MQALKPVNAELAEIFKELTKMAEKSDAPKEIAKGLQDMLEIVVPLAKAMAMLAKGVVLVGSGWAKISGWVGAGANLYTKKGFADKVSEQKRMKSLEKWAEGQEERSRKAFERARLNKQIEETRNVPLLQELGLVPAAQSASDAKQSKMIMEFKNAPSGARLYTPADPDVGLDVGVQGAVSL